jgi:hypothetical protein
MGCGQRFLASIRIISLLTGGKAPCNFGKCPCFEEKCSQFLKWRETAVSYGKDRQNPKWCRSKILIPWGKFACFLVITGENRERQGETGSRRNVSQPRSVVSGLYFPQDGKASKFPRVRLVSPGLRGATSGISVLWVSGAGLCSLFSNFRFGGRETGSTVARDRFAQCTRCLTSQRREASFGTS